jgi:hypothetical protein
MRRKENSLFKKGDIMKKIFLLATLALMFNSVKPMGSSEATFSLTPELTNQIVSKGPDGYAVLLKIHCSSPGDLPFVAQVEKIVGSKLADLGIQPQSLGTITNTAVTNTNAPTCTLYAVPVPNHVLRMVVDKFATFRSAGMTVGSKIAEFGTKIMNKFQPEA